MLALLEALDWTVVGIYAAIVVSLGIWYGRKSKTAEDHLVGGRRLPWWAIGISIIATSFSSISLVALTDDGARRGMHYFHTQAGDLLGMVIVAAFFLPRYQKHNLLTAYELLELRFGRAASRLASALFVLTVLARAGILLFAIASPLAYLLEVPLAPCIVGVGLIAMVYSTLGGMRAVVWTDTLQFLLIIGSVVTCFVVLAADLPGGAQGLADAVSARTASPFPNFDPDPARFPTFWTGLLAYGILAASIFGTNQQTVQRFLATKDVRAARRAGFLGWGLGAVIAALCLALGAAIATWTVHQGGEVLAKDTLATFVGARLPGGLKGVVVAGLLAAAMSSMDSTIHSMATSTWVDFLRPRGGVANDRHVLRVTMLLTVIYGVFAILAGLYAASQGEAIIQLLLKWMGWLLGPMLGLFLLALFTRSVSQGAALFGVGVGYLGAYAMNLPVEGAPEAQPWLVTQGLSTLWTCALAAMLTLSGALLAAGLGARDGD